MADLFRTTYKVLTDEEKLAMAAVKQAAGVYTASLEAFVMPGREKALAITKIEESVFWAVKSITG